MGSSFSNLQIRSDDHIAVKNALTSLELFPAFVSKPENDWVSVFPLATENYKNVPEQKDKSEICRRLSDTLQTGVFAFAVQDSDVFSFVLGVKGVIVDEYNSWPTYDKDRNLPPVAVGGKPEAVLPYCIAGTTCEAINKVLLSGGKGLDSGLTPGAGLGSIKNQIVNASPWWAKPFVWSGMTLMALWKKDQAREGAVIWRGIRLATAFATLLDIVPERMNSGYVQIKDGSAAVRRRALTHVMSAADAEGEADHTLPADEDDNIEADESGKETSHEAFLLYLAALKFLLSAPLEQDAFKQMCILNGLTFSKQKIDMQGLGSSPLIWTFSLNVDPSFQLTTVPKKNFVTWASSELKSLFDIEQTYIDEQFVLVFDAATKFWGDCAKSGTDDGGNRYAVWQGTAGCLIVYVSPISLEQKKARRSLDLWWEPGLVIALNEIAGPVGDWLNARHPDLL